MKIAMMSAVVILGTLAAGCERDLSLAERQYVPRAYLEQRAVPPTPGSGTVAFPPTTPVDPTQPAEEIVGGTYLFTTPATVTQVKNTTATFSKYELYAGQPKPADKPLVIIEIGPDVVSAAGNGAADLKAETTRVYLLNGLHAEEWTGKTTEGHPFCELIISRGDNGDKLHALGIARDAGSRQVVLDILGSIKWEPKK